MKRLIVAILLGAAVVFAAVSVSTFEIPVWTGRSYTWLRPGPGLVVRDGTLDTLVFERAYDVLLIPGPGGYALPPGASQPVVYVNGLRQHLGEDFRIEGGAVVPLTDAWRADFLVTADFSIGEVK